MNEISRFLIVDDVESNILFFQVLLQGLGKTMVSTTTSGEEALNIVENEKIQFLITAWEMRGMPGTILVQRLRSNRKRIYMPCLIYSKRMSSDDVSLTKELGFASVLGMPFDKMKAAELISTMIKNEEELSPLEIKVRKIEGFVAENKPAEALKLVDASVTKKSPLRPRVKTALGEIWILVKQYKKCELILTECLQEAPDHSPAKYVLARLYSLTGRHAEAIKLLEETAKSSPKNLRTMLNLGSAYVDADKHDQAKAVFKKVEATDPENGELKDEQGKLAFKEGDIPLAAQLLAQTQNGDIIARDFNNLAIAQTAAGQFSQAIETYQNAIKLLADKAKVHLLLYNLGLAHRKAGDAVQSFKCLAESYVLEPTFEKAYAGLARIVQEYKEAGKKPDLELVKKVKAARLTLQPKVPEQKAS
jgi:two-component system chemotaxis response regulator CheY